MAKRNKKNEMDFVQVDAYMIPKAQVEMYRALRNAVKEELLELMTECYHTVEIESDNDQGESLVGYDTQQQEQIRIFLNPTTISQAQKARDKHQLKKLLETLQEQSKGK